jgi:hypothetical protein
MLFVVSRCGDQPSWPKLSTLHRRKTYAVRLLELLAIAGDPMDNLDGAFAKSRTSESPLLDFATAKEVFTVLALHG